MAHKKPKTVTVKIEDLGNLARLADEFRDNALNQFAASGKPEDLALADLAGAFQDAVTNTFKAIRDDVDAEFAAKREKAEGLEEAGVILDSLGHPINDLILERHRRQFDDATRTIDAIKQAAAEHRPRRTIFSLSFWVR